MRATLVALSLALALAPGDAPAQSAPPGGVPNQPPGPARPRGLIARWRASRQPTAPAPGPAAPDPMVRRTQDAPADLPTPLPPLAAPAVAPPPTDLAASAGAQSLSMEAALYGALTSNPDLVSLRQNTPATAEALEVAKRLPTTLNPTLWIDVRPLAWERVPGTPTSPARLDQKDALMYFSLRQPVELGHQQRYRVAIAQAAHDQQRWTVLQAEILALVQTYRLFQTSAYRREKLRVAGDLAAFNDRLVGSLRRRQEGGQVPAADVALGEVEAEATRQQVEAARQDYATALADLHNQLGTPETAGRAEPLGEFILPSVIPPGADAALIDLALRSRPEIMVARSRVEGARAAIGLARGDRIPTPVVGPVYERDEQGTQFFGFVYITPIPVFNNGKPLVRQREAEYRATSVALKQIQDRTVAQVKAAVAKWNGASRLVSQTDGLTTTLVTQVGTLERLFERGQADLTKLLQARQRLIQLENARLDAIWQATQAQSDLLAALGAPALLNSLNQAPPAARASSPASRAPASAPPPPMDNSPEVNGSSTSIQTGGLRNTDATGSRPASTTPSATATKPATTLPRT